MTEEQNEPLNDWLEEYPKQTSRKVQKRHFQTFLRWCNRTPKQLVQEFNQQKTRSLILKFQSHLKNEAVVQKGMREGETGLSDNTVRGAVNAVRAFYTSQKETVTGLKRKVISAKTAKGEDVFSLSDLQKIWHISDTRDKAIISLGCSLGWEASAFLDMERPFFEWFVKRARSEDLDFIAFDYERKKTGAEQYGILTPCALDSLERWLEHADGKRKKRNLWNGLTRDGLNKILKRLTKEANIATIGRVRWHLLRKWLMSTLSRSGLNEWQTKIILGKAIPTTDLTYLPRLKEDAFEKYKQAYPLAMSLVAYSNDVRKVENIEEIIGTLTRALIGLYQRQTIKEGRPKLEPIAEVTKAYTTDIEGSTDMKGSMLKELNRILALVKKEKP